MRSRLPYNMTMNSNYGTVSAYRTSVVDAPSSWSFWGRAIFHSSLSTPLSHHVTQEPELPLTIIVNCIADHVGARPTFEQNNRQMTRQTDRQTCSRTELN